MAQEVYRPGQRTPAEQRSTSKQLSEVEILDNSIGQLRDKINLFDRMVAHRKAGKNAAAVVVAMQKDVAEAQREIVQHHANLIAKNRKMELTEHFQDSLMGLTRRVEEKTASETAHYWQKLVERENYYEEFFGSRIREIDAKVAAGEMEEARGAERKGRYLEDRNSQQEQDRLLLQEIMNANERIVRKSLADYQPS